LRVGLPENGLAARSDIAVVGLDNLPESKAWTSPLTTIEMLPRTVGMEAARPLLRRLAEPQAKLASIRLSPRPVVRAPVTNRR
jgi:LacI family transcriptional regulator